MNINWIQPINLLISDYSTLLRIIIQEKKGMHLNENQMSKCSNPGGECHWNNYRDCITNIFSLAFSPIFMG